MTYDYIPTCHCGEQPGKKTILNTQAHVGITTEFLDNGVFINNHALYLENRFCPQCGAPRKIIEVKDDDGS